MKYTYTQAIEASIKDLEKRGNSDLLLLAKYLGLPETSDMDDTIYNIAITLIDRHYPDRKGNMDPSLPYGGDINKAMTAGDRTAIREIMQYRQSQEAERNRKILEEQESNRIPEIAKDCSNDADLISLEDWSETNKPNLKIKYMSMDDPITKVNRIVCYDSEELKRSLDILENTFAAWIPNNRNYFEKPDSDGKGERGSGGFGPAKTQKFYKLPDGNFVQFYNPDEITSVDYLVAIPYAKKRIGNIWGTFGVSELHGQVPDKTVYFAYPPGMDLETHARNLLKEDYEARFPLTGFALDRTNDDVIIEKLITFFKSKIPKEMPAKLKEYYKICPCEMDMHTLIDDLFVKLWPSIGHNDVLDTNIVSQEMIDVYKELYSTIGRENIKSYWIENVVDPYIDTLTGKQALEILIDIHDRVPQANEDYENNNRIQESLPERPNYINPFEETQFWESQQTPQANDSRWGPSQSPSSQTQSSRENFSEIEEKYIYALDELMWNLYTDQPGSEDLVDLFIKVRVEYLQYIIQNPEPIEDDIDQDTIEEQINDIWSQLTVIDRLINNVLARIKDEEEFIEPEDAREFHSNNDKYIELYKKYSALRKQLNPTAIQLTFGEESFGGGGGDIRIAYEIALENLIEELQTEDQTDAPVTYDEYAEAVNVYFYHILSTLTIPEHISEMDLETVERKIADINREYNIISEWLQDFRDDIREDLIISEDRLNDFVEQEAAFLKLYTELKAAEKHRDDLLANESPVDPDEI